MNRRRGLVRRGDLLRLLACCPPVVLLGCSSALITENALTATAERDLGAAFSQTGLGAGLPARRRIRDRAHAGELGPRRARRRHPLPPRPGAPARAPPRPARDRRAQGRRRPLVHRAHRRARHLGACRRPPRRRLAPAAGPGQSHGLPRRYRRPRIRRGAGAVRAPGRRCEPCCANESGTAAALRVGRGGRATLAPGRGLAPARASRGGPQHGPRAGLRSRGDISRRRHRRARESTAPSRAAPCA